MRILHNTLTASATDLANHLGCSYMTSLDRAVAEGRLAAAPKRDDPVLNALIERGNQHESDYADFLAASGLSVVKLERSTPHDEVKRLMAAGTDVIFQAPLGNAHFGGYADFLHKVPTPSALGNFSYEVTDTKLALHTKAGTILQLNLYSELIADIQGKPPEYMHVVRPSANFEKESFRLDDFGAYYRLVKDRLAAVLAAPPDTSLYPEPVASCAVCRWWATCGKLWRDDDHLSLVAGLTTRHTAEFNDAGINTLEQLGDGSLPLPHHVSKGRRATYDRLQNQARVQLEGRRAGKGVWKRLALEEKRGLLRLPAPDAGDVFFDIEAARFFENGGLEYLLGWCTRSDDGELTYSHRWSRSRAEEKGAFEEFMDEVMSRWEKHPGMHIYFYTPYEPSALKRLVGRYGTREAELDRLLRAGRLIDLYAVARQGIRASVERYSLKDLELFAGYRRKVDLREASFARRRIEAVLDNTQLGEVNEADVAIVQGYNREDCEATSWLRDWLEAQRAEWVSEGQELQRPELLDGTAPEGVSEANAEVQEVVDALLGGLPEDREEWNDEQRATGLLAEMLNYYRREENCGHWEFFRMHDREEEELREERGAVAGLEFVEALPLEGRGRIPVHRYSYESQEVSLKDGADCYEVGVTDQQLGKVVAHNFAGQTIDIKKTGKTIDVHPRSIMIDGRVRAAPKPESLLEFARSVAEFGIDGDGPYRAGRDLLLRRPPRRRGVAIGGTQQSVRQVNEPLLDAAIRTTKELDNGLLPIQGPPGSGKTYTAGRVILELSKTHRVAVTAVSHKVIRNLLLSVHEAASEAKTTVLLAHKDGADDPAESLPIVSVKNNGDALLRLKGGHVVGGTGWLWSRPDAVEAVDYLFVDEAGQMSIVDVLAISRAAKNIVLLGDPRQLEQPQQAAHPDGTDVAALQHILGEHKTLPEERGLFLDTTWRLHPTLASFTSELYYEKRLLARDENKLQRLGGPTRFAPGGLFFEAVQHVGNQSDSPEEVDVVKKIVDDLLQAGTTWTNTKGETRSLSQSDVLIVAPYNAQIAALSRAMPELHIGTVDKFQGQEAPVVIYSMTSSSPEDAPRGMSFLYSPNRFNVATSRAKGAVIVVGSPRLLEPECHTPDQMRWANGFCRFMELANPVLRDGAAAPGVTGITRMA